MAASFEEQKDLKMVDVTTIFPWRRTVPMQDGTERNQWIFLTKLNLSSVLVQIFEVVTDSSKDPKSCPALVFQYFFTKFDSPHKDLFEATLGEVVNAADRNFLYTS
jgi:hypothetical protein